MERFSITMNSDDIDLFERRRAELGLTKSAYIRYLIAEHENGVPEFISFQKVIKQISELNTYMKEIIINENFDANDKLLFYEKINTVIATVKRAIAPNWRNHRKQIGIKNEWWVCCKSLEYHR